LEKERKEKKKEMEDKWVTVFIVVSKNGREVKQAEKVKTT